MTITDSSVALRCVAVGTTALLLAGLPLAAAGQPAIQKATPQLKADTMTMPDSKKSIGTKYTGPHMLRAGTPGKLKTDTEVTDYRERGSAKAVTPGTAAVPSMTVKGSPTGQIPVTGGKNRDAVKWEGPDFDAAKNERRRASGLNPKQK